METEILHGPGNAAARILLQPGETITCEGGSMVCMSNDLAIETSTHKREGGGFLAAAKRLLTGQSFFLNHYTASANGGQIVLAATLPGDMLKLAMDGETLIVSAGCFVACTPDVTMDMSWQGFKTMFSGESLFWLRLGGTGKLVLSSYGAIYPVQVNGEYIVDTGHIVAFSETLDFKLTKVGKSWIRSFLGGEGVVCKFHGQGIVWCQSHNPPGFGQTLGPMLKPR